MSITTRTRRLLDSDNEYPDISSDELEECVEMPAYLMDDRFEKINNKFIEIDFDLNRHLTLQANEKHNRSVTILKKIENNLYSKTSNGSKVVIERCVLTKQDMLCLREVEPKVSDAVFVWFLNYVKHKDLQKFCEKHLISCLVPDSQPLTHNAADPPFKKMHDFRLIDTGRL